MREKSYYLPVASSFLSYSFSRLDRPSKITTLLLPANASDSSQAFLASEQLSPLFFPFPSERCGLSRLQRVYTHTHRTHSRKAFLLVVWAGPLFKPCRTIRHPGSGSLSLMANKVNYPKWSNHLRAWTLAPAMVWHSR